MVQDLYPGKYKMLIKLVKINMSEKMKVKEPLRDKMEIYTNQVP